MRFLSRSLLGLFLMAVTLGLLTFAAASVWTAVQAKLNEVPFARPAQERVLAVNVLTVTPGTATPSFETFGEVVSRRTLDLRAPSGGPVLRLAENFVEGAAIPAGTLLLEIDPADAQAALDVARTDLEEARASLRDAERTLTLAQDDLAGTQSQVELRQRALTRQQDLAARGVGSAAAVETAELAVAAAEQSVLSKRQALATAESRIDTARTTLARREIALAEAERRLADTRLTADFDGVLSDVAVLAGGLVSANERVARLIDPTELEVAFRLSTAQYARLLDDSGRLRQVPVRITLDADGIDISTEATITRESASVGEGQTGRQLFAPLDSAAGFRPGDFVTVTVVEPPLERVAVLPATAVDAAGNLLVLGEGDRLEAGQVEILRRQGDDVIVRARALAGREVVAERSPLLGIGIRVAPIREGQAEAPPEPEMLTLDAERRARLIAFVEANTRMPAEVRQRMLSQLQEEQVPAEMVTRLESRMGS